MSGVKAIVFDLGETLVDETRMWRIVAHEAHVPLLTFAGVLGGVIERRRPHRAVFEELGIDPIDATEHGYELETSDFYPDAIPMLHALQQMGYLLGVAGNQPPGAVQQLAGLELPLDLIASSDTFGVEKPDPRFFEQIVSHFGMPAASIVYVGDRLDNDVMPAQAVGMQAVFIRRGPWGYIHSSWPEVARVTYQISSLRELPSVLGRIKGNG